MKNMFTLCTELTELDLSHFNTCCVQDMRLMFSGCYQLEKLDISSFKLDNKVDIRGMFQDCLNLKEVVLPKHRKSRKSLTKQLEIDSVQCAIR
jgi:surface protein